MTRISYSIYLNETMAEEVPINWSSHGDPRAATPVTDTRLTRARVTSRRVTSPRDDTGTTIIGASLPIDKTDLAGFKTNGKWGAAN